ncbi:desulfoferrodoxin family protein [Variovorax ureilyticus]|uniref:Desulfoferrodoxin family protein n=1 Tax=Variovorax ureilyticus TaxID=1836198 RepID=A0ABU8VA36_9BURK
MNTPSLAHFVWLCTPLQGAIPAARQSRFLGISGLRAVAAALAVAMGLGAGVAAHGEEDQAQQFTPEFRELHKGFDGKHTPKITAPDSVKRGAWFTVTVSIGADSMHPSLQEHFVRYIALYKDSVEIARAYLHPVYSAPTVTFTVALDEGGLLRAIAEPTHSAAWEASKKIAVVP